MDVGLYSIQNTAIKLQLTVLLNFKTALENLISQITISRFLENSCHSNFPFKIYLIDNDV